MDLQTRIKKYSLSRKQLMVVESLLSDLEANSFLSGQEVCKKFNISISFLSRMAKNLQLSGFPHLKREIELLYKNETSPTSQAKDSSTP